ncbi:MAG: UPF0175 family protein [Chloroflexota bacterium]
MLLQLGHWDTTDQVLTDALDALMARDPALREAVAIELYRQDSVSLSRAAEIAGMDRWSFADALRAHQIEIMGESTTAAEIAEMLDSVQLPV